MVFPYVHALFWLHVSYFQRDKYAMNCFLLILKYAMTLRSSGHAVSFLSQNHSVHLPITELGAIATVRVPFGGLVRLKVQDLNVRYHLVKTQRHILKHEAHISVK